MLISIAECFHYGQFLVKVFGYHSYSVDLLVTTVWWTHTYLNIQELWNTASETEQVETWQHSKRIKAKFTSRSQNNLDKQICPYTPAGLYFTEGKTNFDVDYRSSYRVSDNKGSSLLFWKISPFLDFPHWTSCILIWISCILIKCLPPYIMKWIGLLMSISLLQLDCSQSPIFSWDRRNIARLTVNGGHLDFQMYRVCGRRGL